MGDLIYSGADEHYSDEMKKSPRERQLDLLEAEIQDIKLLLAGSSHSKRWQTEKMKLANLQNERRSLLYSIFGSERYPNNRKEDTGAPPTNLREQIPDL